MLSINGEIKSTIQLIVGKFRRAGFEHVCCIHIDERERNTAMVSKKVVKMLSSLALFDFMFPNVGQ